MTRDALAWTVPVMRLGYVGRGLTNLVVAGISLWAIWHGGQAQGTSQALAGIETAPGGKALLAVIFLGLLAYAAWRFLDAAFDLDDHGDGAKGAVGRAAVAVTGVIYLGLGIGALGLLRNTSSGGSGDSRLEGWVASVLGWPAGRWLVGLAALAIMAAGAKYVWQGWTASYERKLRSTPASIRWRNALRAGVAAHGITILIVGLLFLLAAWHANAEEAGGLDGAFDWLSAQAYGRALVTLLCVGLVGFSLFCFVNARWRIVPRVAGDKTETLARMVRGAVAGVV